MSTPITCVSCTRDAEPDRARCEICLESIRKAGRKYRELKAILIARQKEERDRNAMFKNQIEK